MVTGPHLVWAAQPPPQYLLLFTRYLLLPTHSLKWKPTGADNSNTSCMGVVSGRVSWKDL